MIMLLVVASSLILLLGGVSCVSLTCAVGESHVDRNGDIDPEVRDYIYGLNDLLIQSVERDDMAAVLALFADVMREDEDLVREFAGYWPQIVEVVKDREFATYADYHWTWTGVGEIGRLLIPRRDEDFTIKMEAVSDQQFISLLETPGEFDSIMLGLVYAVFDDGWELYSLRIGSFRVANRSAPEWYEEAAALYDAGCLVPAALRLQMANSCISPVPFMEYVDEDGIKDLTETVESEIGERYSFPIEVSGIDSRPVVFAIEPQFVQSSLLPKVNYVTSESLDNVEYLEAEANALVPEIERLFPCLTEGVDHILFYAYTELPVDPSRTYPVYGIPVELKR